MEDVLIVCYSRTGKTRMVAEKLAALLGADLAEIKERKDRAGVLGFLSAGADTLLKRRVELVEVPQAGGHRVVVLGTPVWAFQPPAPVRAYLAGGDLSGRVVCVFTTSHAAAGGGTARAIGRILGAPPVETFHWARPRADDPAFDAALAAWAERLRAL